MNGVVPERTVNIGIRHNDARLAADVSVEALDRDGFPIAATESDINGVATLRLVGQEQMGPAARLNLRVAGTQTYLGLPIQDTVVYEKGESEAKRITIRFNPALSSGDTWYQAILNETAEIEKHRAGETMTLETGAAPRYFFMVAGNDTEGIRHAALVRSDGSGDIAFTAPILEPWQTYGNQLTVTVAGITAAPTCRHFSLPNIDGDTAALVYPKSATSLTVFSFARDRLPLPGSAGKLNQPSALECTFVAEAGPCLGSQVTALVPLLGTSAPLDLDWSSPFFIPFTARGFPIVDAQILNDSTAQHYDRSKGGICALPKIFVPWTYLTGDIQLANGVFHGEIFYSKLPSSFEMLLPQNPDIETTDNARALELRQGCGNCYQIAEVTGMRNGQAVSVVAPFVDGSATIPKALFDRRDRVGAYGYSNDIPYSAAVTLPMQGYPAGPGRTRLVPISPNIKYYRWQSER
jgi:hypothetical protein